MTILKASRLKAVLDKARNAGQVEEAVTVTGISIIVSSLTAEDYSAILTEVKNSSEEEYYADYQLEHVCRSIVEVDGESLRGVDFIEVEGEPGAPLIKVERHQWLKDNLISTWSREVLYVVFRKVCEAIEAAETKASEGVQFRIEAESEEEKYRRLLAELKQAGEELPVDMREAILKEEGLLPAASKSELEDLASRAKTWGSETTAEEETVGESTPVRAPQQIVQAADPMALTEPAPPPNSARVPLNQRAIRDPVPVNSSDQAAAAANRRSPRPPPDQVHDLTTKAERIAAIEALELDPDVVVMQREPKTDAVGARTIMDKPPQGGHNPRFVSPFGHPPPKKGGLNPRSRG